MSMIGVEKDFASLSLTLIAQFDAPVERVWQLWADPRMLEPSVSHHLSRLEAETGTQLLQKAGRGIRLTQTGRLLADRAAERSSAASTRPTRSCPRTSV